MDPCSLIPVEADPRPSPRAPHGSPLEIFDLGPSYIDYVSNRVRYTGTVPESECLCPTLCKDNQGILFGEQSLRRVTREFLAHYHRERNHQGLDNQLIFPSPADTDLAAPIERRQRLGGMLNYYYRRAA